MTKNVAIALGLGSGLTLGLAAAFTQEPSLLAAARAVAPVGDVFLNLIRLVVVPLVATTLFAGVATLGDLRRLGRLGVFTLLFYWGTTFIAIGIGMAVTAAALPLAGPGGTLEAGSVVTVEPLPGIVEFLVRLVPANVIQAAAEGALLPLMVFVVLFGAAAGTLAGDERRRLLELAESVTRALVVLVHWILWTAPVGVFALAAPVAADLGLEMVRQLAVFVLAVLAALAVFFTAVYLPLVRLWSAIPIARFLKANGPVAAIAFSTTSSAATLPVMFEAAERELGISRSVTSFVIPLGVSLNRSGSALYQGGAIVFLAHAYGVGIEPTAIGAAILATFLVALTIAAVPSASVMTLPPALDAVGVPLDGLGMLLGIDRIPDMFRTVVNVTGDMAAATILDGPFGDPAPPPETAG